ncbi:hypothetical protein [Halopelagius fulvigenes]|uniref:Right handed beta helix domain-containing protein n=1 Tax=Halopelagius fulvigenes TaxID=1198324 RepID=A0ABD5TYN8_9EURY
MPLEIQSENSIDSLTINQLLHLSNGDAWESGCDASLTSDSTDITVDITSGEIRLGGTTVSVNAQQVSLQAGDLDDPRKDLIAVDTAGSCVVLPGTPEPALPDGTTDEDAYQPSVEELDGEAGNYLALWEVWVPAEADASTDLDDPEIQYLKDRRLGSPAGDAESVRDVVAGFITAGADITTSHNDKDETFTIDFDGVDEFPTDTTVTFSTENVSEGLVSRPLAWDAGKRTLYCSPNGTADAAGTQSDPLTLQGAIDSLPFFLSDEVVIDLFTVPNSNGNLPAVYNNGSNTYRPPVMTGLSTLADVTFLGNPSAPADVVVENGINWACYGKGDSFLDGIQFNASVQLNGFATARDCNIYQKGNYGTAGICVGIKKGTIKLKGCNIGEGNVATAINVTDSANVGLVSSNITASSGSHPLSGGPGTKFTAISGTSATSANGVDSPKGVGNMTNAELKGVVDGQGTELIENNGRRLVHQGSAKEIYEPRRRGPPNTVYLSNYESADPSGATTSDTGLDFAIADCNPGDTLVIDDGTYLLDSTHVINKPLTIRGENATLTRTVNSTDINEDGAIVFRGGGVQASSALSADVSQGTNDIPVTDASLFSVDDYVYLFDNGSVNVNTANAMTFGRVTSVDTTNNIVTMSTTAREDFTTANNATLYQVDLLESPRIENLRCEGDDSAQTSSWFKFDWCADSVYEDVHVNGFIFNALGVYHCWRHTTDRCTIEKPYLNGSSEGEAFQHHKSQDLTLIAPKVAGGGASTTPVRRGIDFHKSSHDAVVINPQIEQFTLAGVSTHQGPVKNIEVVGGYIGQEDFGNASASGGCVVTDSGGAITLSGTELLCGRRGLVVEAGGRIDATDVTLIPRNGATETGVYIEAGSADIEGRIDDPSGQMVNAVEVRATGAVTGVALDLDIVSGGGDPVYIHSAGANVSDVTLAGRLESTGTGDAVTIEAGATGEVVSNVTLDEFDIVGGHAGRGVVTAGAGTVEFVSVSRSRIDTSSGNVAAVIATNASYDALTNLRVQNCDCTAGTATAVQMNEPDASYVWVTNNRGTVTIDANATNVVQSGNQ